MSAYVLGHADPELARLERQGRFLHDLTREVLLRAGIRPGMEVLDVGVGAGDVSLILAELVGPTGRVHAVDRAPEAVERATARLRALGVDHVDVEVADPIRGASGRTYDAVVGRLVLLHQPEPAAAVVALSRLVRPGGVLVSHEIEIQAGHWSSHPLPLFAQSWGWIVGAFTRGGMVKDIGAHLAEGFAAAGLRDVRLMREGRVERDNPLAHEFIARTVRSLLPAMERFGIATAAEVDPDTLEARLVAEAEARHAQLIPVFFTAAWARKGSDTDN